MLAVLVTVSVNSYGILRQFVVPSCAKINLIWRALHLMTSKIILITVALSSLAHNRSGERS
jgi:hypothetical protein